MINFAAGAPLNALLTRGGKALRLRRLPFEGLRFALAGVPRDNGSSSRFIRAKIAIVRISVGDLFMTEKRSEAEKAAIRAEVERVRLEHHDLEAAIDALMAVGAADQLQIQRLKKRKLLLRDRLRRLEDDITPDIIA
jgi:hypothetical protein